MYTTAATAAKVATCRKHNKSRNKAAALVRHTTNQHMYIPGM
jgi:hypothetical protein